MNFLERLDKNIEPYLAHSWLALAWFEIGTDMEMAVRP